MSEILLLAGYVGAFPTGFALPCFGASPRPNAWSLALAEVPGDHRSRIAGFEPFDSDLVEHLPGDRVVRAAVGDPWLDVFCFDGKPWIGTPETILAGLGPSFEDLIAAAPLDALDLALAAGHAQTSEILGAARAAVAELHGEDRANAWLSQLVVRPQARVEVRRRLVEAGLADDLNRAREIRVVETGKGLRIAMPPQLTEALARAGRPAALDEAAQAISHTLSVPISVQDAATAAPIQGVHVYGSRHVPLDLVLATAGLSVGGALSDDILSQAEERVRELAVFERVDVSQVDGMVEIRVTENPIIEEVVILGAHRVSENRIRRAMAVHAGQVYSPPRLADDARRISDMYAPDSVDGKVDLKVERRGGQAIVTVRIDEGAPYRPPHTHQDVLIWARGKRARETVRLLSNPSWSPTPTLAYLLEDPRQLEPRLPTADLVRIQVTLERPSRESLGEFKVVVLLVDEVDDVLRLLTDLLRNDDAGLAHFRVLIAPTLPPDHPSDLFTNPDLPPTLPMAAALLDTSVVRSPFWTYGNTTSTARLLADYVVGGAMLMALDAIPSLLERVDTKGLPLLSFAGEQRFGRMALMSEAAPEFPAIDELEDRRLTFQMYNVMKPGPPGFGYIRLSDTAGSFDAFARAAFDLAATGYPPRPAPDDVENASIDARWHDQLRAPRSSALLGEQDGVKAAGGGALIVAEAPSLELLLKAEGSGVSVVRYTDTATLRRLAEPSRSALLPAEICVPPLPRRTTSAGLFVRGAEPHILAKISGQAFEAIAPTVSGPLAPVIRRLRTSVESPGPADVVVPLADALEAFRQRDDLAHIFLTSDQTRRTRPVSYRALRSWVRPIEGLDRFVFSEAASRIVVSRLGDDEIAGSRMMTVDGDLAVPFLLTSRPFQLWIRTQCQNLGSRFRLSIAALEAFPQPSFMRVIGEGVVATPALVLTPDRIADVSSCLAAPEGPWKGPMIGEPEALTDAGRELERMILADYDLPPDSTDIQIMHRLAALAAMRRCSR